MDPWINWLTPRSPKLCASARGMNILAAASPGPAMAYSTGGWLSLRRGQRQEEGNPDDGRSNGTALPDDMLAVVFTRLTDAADVLRCAFTCRRWCRVVAKEAAALARAFPHELVPGRASFVGLCHQAEAGPVPCVSGGARKRKRDGSRSSPAGAGQPYVVVPCAAAARLLGFRSPSISLTDGGRHGALLEHSRPVASRNGWVVLELGRGSHADDSLHLCVFNPMTGDIAQLPSLSGEDRPRCYACALLTGDDDDLRAAPPSPATTSSFRVLIVYNRSRFTALRAYSSDTRRWGTEFARTGGPKIDNCRLRKLGQSVVLRGVAYWPLRRSALAVRLDGPDPIEVPMPPSGVSADQPQQLRLLGVIRDRKQQQQQVCFIDARLGFDEDLHRAGLPCRAVFLLTRVLTVDGEDDSGTSTGKWVQEGRIDLPGMMVRSLDAVHLRWFCEKSGVVLFTVREDSNGPGAYALDLRTHKVEKLADGAVCHSWRNVVGYEMGASARIASLACY